MSTLSYIYLKKYHILKCGINLYSEFYKAAQTELLVV
jgi:predicted nucleic-acid-binding Zn-ribbon protein